MARNTTTPRVEDLLPVKSRVSWAAILAGAVVALAVLTLLGLLAAAIGLSVADRVRFDTFSTWSALAALFGLVVALFVGGFITTQLAVGENKVEAATHGIIMWGVVTALVLGLGTLGAKVGFSDIVGMALGNDARAAAAAGDWETLAKKANVSQEDIDAIRAKVTGSSTDPNAPVERAQAANAAWWAFGGTLLSILAAVGGALVGAGPTFQLIPIRTVDGRVVERETVVKT